MDVKTLEARVLDEGSPVIDLDQATFVWRGSKPVSVRGDFQDWQGAPLPLEQLAPRLWARSLPLPSDSYVEYALVDARGRRVKDPLNHCLSDNGMGKFNHFFRMPENRPAAVARRGRGAHPRGRVTRHKLETSEFAVGRTREVFLYQPAAPGPYPLLLVLDGPDYLRRASLAVVLDNLIRQKRIRPIAMALVANGGPARTVEYTCSEATLGLMRDKVLALAREKLPLVDERRKPGVHAVLGASYGGLMALYLGLRAPQVFGHVLSQSGAFAIPEHGDFVVFDLARAAPSRRLKVWMDCGRFEWLTGCNRRMFPVLKEAGHRVRYQEYSGGHNYPAWRDDVVQGLEWLFPP
ncbi:alpha/beta hydrolase-fold protein [Hyalangium rubrum]|uniref:Alpha/beta hydrolase-fold protein n=1 Tax=Hyalangium rubrum TaxID=3103134 RepID=A0ABU5GZY5_9BACT|nr:alpha/beta hydrolase-fold protein [Hyalangium sp. s54d21]MDY7226259.1 alpha/beta hydrolase-fold protein [Hyalangium sp. s54d21]